MISCTASLVHHGLLKSLDRLAMVDVDLSDVPSKHLLSLASCVTERLAIVNVQGFDLVAILDSVECEVLQITRQNLSTEETQALVRAMETRVEETWLGFGSKVSLDIEALTQYNGQGKCRSITIASSSLSLGTEEKYENWLQLDSKWCLNKNLYGDYTEWIREI